MQEVCFDGLGCFNNSLYCHRFGFPPDHPDAINTRFYLYTRSNPDQPDQLDSNDRKTFGRFDPVRETKIIFHGYMDSHEVSHMVNLRESILRTDNVNLIMVNWNGGADGHYHTARLNIRVVGRQTATMIKFIRENFNSDMNIHLIGHSLGAHAAGYAGEEAGGIQRITGLDPAGPWFRNEVNPCRLDITDASFVDVIHTNANAYGFGLPDQLGHQDFYPNGGSSMPGCGMFSVICHHLRSIGYFIASMSCPFTAYRCDSWEDFTSGVCNTDCSNGVCAEMGYHVGQNQSSGKYYLRTEKYEPFCSSN
ncbi:putative pancreatic lipase-related protein 2 isoform X2 [Apostichopus japonicus]|uniref:Putative pancreatic lipase-related protein 2 isoform X2 n=1 Tax=Stichopus japonicus TaxID=307972 RepID=A0A2G8KWV2_STIJA|nr:putative pancreatic lipase-related protein 2 isoform X2 [Apostichopus japonicus]